MLVVPAKEVVCFPRVGHYVITYDLRFEDIQEAMDYDSTEFDWWIR